MIEYYIDGSTKDFLIGAGIVKVNEFGFIEKHHFSTEHVQPTSNLAESYALEKTFELIRAQDKNRNELINIYTDSQKLYNSFLYNENSEFTSTQFFKKQESIKYFQYLRTLYIELISKYSTHPIYHCHKTNQARPFIKIYYKDYTENKKYLQEAHSLSRTYISTEEANPEIIELKAVRENSKWYIVKDNKDVVAENKRPIIALSDALKQMNGNSIQIKLCETLVTILKNTNMNKVSSESMKSALKVIEGQKFLINL